jgi:hypothetical protein
MTTTARGRRERGSSAPSRSARQRAANRLIEGWEKPQMRATSAWERPIDDSGDHQANRRHPRS